MSSVDERIVEMKFDNKEFEPGAKTTLSTLEKLKQALKFDTANNGLSKLDSAAKGIDISRLTAGVEALQNRFSTLGIVGMRIISNLTDSMMNLASKGVNFMTSGIIHGGYSRASNIENAKFQIQGLGYEWSQLEKQIDFAVNQTAYGLDSAAKAASTLLASGVEISDTFDASAGNLDQMGIALRAISGVAAQTNSDYDSIAHIFETVAGNGRLMGDQLNQLAYRGMNVAATLGKALGKSESEIRDMVSKSQISFEQFSQIMYDAFGEHAVKANETFSGSLSNVRAALARIGQAFYTPLIKQNGPLVELFNTLRVKINEVKNAITKAGGPIENLANIAIKFIEAFKEAIGDFEVKKFFLSLSDSVSGFTRILDSSLTIITNTVSALSNVLGPIKRAFKAAFPKSILDVLGDATEKLASFTDTFLKRKKVFKNPIENGDLVPGMSTETRTIYQTSETIQQITSVASGLFGIIRIGVSAVGALGEALKPVATYIGSLGGGFLEIAAKIGDAIKGFADFAEETDFFGKKIQNAIDFVKQLIEDFEYITGIDLKLPTADDLVNGFDRAVERIKEFRTDVSDFLINLKADIEYITGVDLKMPSVEDLKNAFDSAKTSIENFKKTLENTKNNISKFLKQIHDDFQELTGIDIHIPSIYELKDTVETIKKFVSDTKATITDFINNNQGIKDFIASIKEAFSNFHVDLSGFNKFFSGINENMKPAEKILGFISAVISFIFSLASAAIPVIKTVAGEIGEFAKKLWAGIKELFGGESYGSALKNTTLAVVFYQVAQILRQFNLLKDEFNVRNTFGKLLSNIKGVIFEFSKSIKVSYFLKAASAVLILALALKMLSTIDADKIGVGLLAMKYLIEELKVTTKYISSINANGLTGIAGPLLGLAVSVLVLVNAVKALSKLDLPGLAKGIVGVSILLFELTAVAKALQTDKGMMTGISGLIAMAVAIRILASSMKSLGKMDTNSLVLSFMAISGLLLELTVISKALSGADNMMAGLSGLLVMAVSVKILASAMKSLTKIGDLTSLAVSFGVITGLLLELTMIAGTLSHADSMMQGISGLLVMAVAVKVLVSAMKSLSTIKDTTSLVLGFMAVTGLMTVMTAVAKALQDSKSGMAKAAVGFLIMSVAIIAIAKALSMMANIGDEGIFLSLIALGGAMTAIAVAMNAVQNSLKGAAAILIVSAALIPLAAAMKMLGSLNIQQVVTSLVMLLGTMTLMGWAAVILKPFIVEILSLSAAFVIFAAGAALMGVSAIALAAGLAALGPAINVFVTGVMSAIYQLIAGLGNSSVELVVAVGQIVVALFEGLASAAYAIKDAAVALIVALCQGIVQTLPVVISMGVVVIASFLEGIGRNIKRIVVAAVTLVVNFIDGISTMMPVLASAGMNLMVNFINSMADAIRTHGADLLDAMNNLMASLVEFALTALQSLVKDIPGIGAEAVKGLEKAKSQIREKMAPKEAEKTGYNYTRGLGSGIEEGSGQVEEAARHAGTGGTFALEESIFGEEEGETAVQNLSAGILNGEPDLLSNTNLLGQEALTNLDISDLTGQTGASSIENYLSGMDGVDTTGTGTGISDEILAELTGKNPEYNEAGQEGRREYEKGWTESTSEHQKSWDKIQYETEHGIQRVYIKGAEKVDEGTSTMIERHRKNASRIEKSAENYIATPTAEGATNVDTGKSADTNAAKYSSTMSSTKTQNQSKSAAYKGLASPTMVGATDASGAQKAANTTAGGFTNTIGNSYNQGRSRTGGLNLSGAANTGARSNYGSLVSTGNYLAGGLQSGFESRFRDIKALAQQRMRDTINAMRAVAVVASPSKKTMEIGSYMGEGLMIGLMQWKDKLQKAGAGVTDGTLVGINSVLTNVSDILNGNLNLDPTIRPVLDTSLLQNGLTSVDGMLNTQRSMALAAGVSLNASNVGPTLEQQIGTAVDNALNKIYDKIEEASAKTPYQINVPLNLDKRTFARATATVTREELDRIDYFNNRKAGIA